MSRFFKVVALIFAVGLLAVPAFAEVIDDSANIVIGIEMPSTGEATLTVSTIDITTGAVIDPMSLSFDAGDATLAAPWISANEYINVVYDVTLNATWGVRIITDNEDLEGDGNDVIDTLVALDADGDVAGVQASYSGLIDTTQTDPSRRAGWAWQVFADPIGVGADQYPTVPASTVDPGAGGGTVLNDKNAPEADANSVGPWNAAWGYIADKNNFDYNGDILEDGDLDGAVDDLTYPMVLVGPPGGGNGGLQQHPQADPKPGDAAGIAVYLAARWANTNYGDPAEGDDPFAYLLPNAIYSASLYVELIHE